MTVFEDDVAVELGLPDGPLEDDKERDPFASKIGGRPALLFPSSILKAGEVLCTRCKSHMYLLLQMDCPLDEESEVERVMYVFACNTRECTESGKVGVVTALVQCQRRRKEVAKQQVGLWDSFAGGSDLAEDLEKLDMSDSTEGFYLADFPVSFPATALHIVDELIANPRALPKRSIVVEPDVESSEVWQGEVYEKMQIMGYDKIFKNFHTRVAHYPRQLVRYSPEGEPLLFNADPLPKIEPCNICGQFRHFDLQLMPAILCKLPTNEPKYLQHIPKDGRSKHPLYGDGMEWGTIFVYTCGACKSVANANDGKHEFLGQVVIQIEKD